MAVLVAPPTATAQDSHTAMSKHTAPTEHRHRDVPTEASGTSWLPATTPVLGWFGSRRGWDLMSHGNAFAQFLLESGEFHRRSYQFGSINWVMGMASRPAYGGRMTVRTMLSAEPWTIRGCGPESPRDKRDLQTRHDSRPSASA